MTHPKNQAFYQLPQVDKMAVFEEYYDTLTDLIGNVDENSFCQVAGKLYAKKIIDQAQKNKAIKEGLMLGAQIIINRVISYVRQKDEAERTAKVLTVLGEVEWLKDNVTKMKGLKLVKQEHYYYYDIIYM